MKLIENNISCLAFHIIYTLRRNGGELQRGNLKNKVGHLHLIRFKNGWLKAIERGIKGTEIIRMGRK